MKTSVPGVGFLGVAIGALLAAAAAGADGERKLSISAVMHKQYTVSNAPFVRMKKELSADAPDWPKVRDAAKRFVALAAALEKNEPLRGDPESWQRLAGQHLRDAKAMDAAAEASDKQALLSIHKRLAASCIACHNAHRARGRG